MRNLALPALLIAATALPTAALAQSDSGAGAPPVIQSVAMARMGTRMQRPSVMPQQGMPMPGRSAPMQGAGRWSGVPGGWNAYRRPAYGYQLPSYWVSPSYFIPNYSVYGLPRPADGFGWSRYYDDVVLTDRWGRVYDVRGGTDWSREPRWQENYSDSYGYRDDRRRDDGHSGGDNALAGAAVGAVVGGVAGNVIAGSGNRLAGTIIGGTAGAIAGGAIGSASGRHRHDGRHDDRRYQDARSRSYTYDGRWTGSWDGGPERVYEGRFEGNVRPHWDMHREQGGYYPQGPAVGYDDGTYSYGGGTTVTTTTVVSSAPVMTRTVSYETEYVRVAAPRRHVVRRARPRQACGCVVGS